VHLQPFLVLFLSLLSNLSLVLLLGVSRALLLYVSLSCSPRFQITRPPLLLSNWVGMICWSLLALVRTCALALICLFYMLNYTQYPDWLALALAFS
jgi:hypothetical protein